MRSFYRMSLLGAILLTAGMAWAITFSSIIIDGDLADFAADEALAPDPADDSTYGANNELTALHLTWDADALYLGLPYRAENTAVMLLLETGKTGGVSDLCYGGAFSANLQGPAFDLLLAFFAPSDHAAAPTPYLYALDAGSSTDISGAAGVQIQLVETVSTLGREGAMEAAIPWDLIYGLGSGAVPPGATLRLAAVIRGALDQDNLGDVSPEPLGGLQPDKCGQGSATVIDQLHQVVIDLDGDGAPDPGRAPGGSSADAGPPADAAPLSDQSLAPDLAPGPDQGQNNDLPLADAAPPSDQGTPGDQSALSEVGANELGPGDAGPGDGTPGADAEKKVLQEEGCNCSVTNNSPGALVSCLLLLGLVVLRRSRREDPRR